MRKLVILRLTSHDETALAMPLCWTIQEVLATPLKSDYLCHVWCVLLSLLTKDLCWIQQLQNSAPSLHLKRSIAPIGTLHTQQLKQEKVYKHKFPCANWHHTIYYTICEAGTEALYSVCNVIWSAMKQNIWDLVQIELSYNPPHQLHHRALWCQSGYQ